MNTKKLKYFNDFFRENRNDKDFMGEMLELFRENLSTLNEQTDMAIRHKDCQECAHVFHHMTNSFSAVRLCKHGEKTRKLEVECKEGCFSNVIIQYKAMKKDMSSILSETDYLLHHYVSRESLLTH